MSRRSLALAVSLALGFLLLLVPESASASQYSSGGLRCTIVGTSGNDSISGTAGRDVICGLGGNDTINGLGGNDVLDGGAGNDTLVGGAGNDSLAGGSGTDTVSFVDVTTSSKSVAANLSTGLASGDGADSLTGDENLTGGAGNDTLTGDVNGNTLTGGAGNDTLVGGAGNDSLAGGTGTDAETGGVGIDSCDTSGSETRDPSCDLLPLMSSYFAHTSGRFNNWNSAFTGCYLVYADSFYGGTIRALIPIQADGSFSYDVPPTASKWSRIMSRAASQSGGQFAPDPSCPFDAWSYFGSSGSSTWNFGASIVKGEQNYLEATMPDLVQITVKTRLPDGTAIPASQVWCTGTAPSPYVFVPGSIGWADGIAARTTDCGSESIPLHTDTLGSITFWAVKGETMTISARATVFGMSTDATSTVTADGSKDVSLTYFAN